MIEGVWGYTGSAALFTTLLDGDIPAMAGFDVEFLNGDHHLKNIFVGGKNAGADEEINDSYL